jgi:ribosome modulation factor
MPIVRINLSQPSKQVYRRDERDPWIEGYEARQTCLARTANPYRGLDTQPLWDEGWLAAQEEANKPRRPLITQR